MEFDGDASTEIRRKTPAATPATKPVPRAGGEPLWQAGPRRRSRSMRALTAGAGVLLAALLAYALFAPGDDRDGWSPPPGLSAKDTAPWLQTLCAKRTPELCALADRARNPSDCEHLHQTLRSLQSLEQQLVAREAISQNQRWVLLELYGQGRELCQFEPDAKAP